MGLFNFLLSHPLTRGMAVDDPQTTLFRRQIIRKKPYLKKIYTEWYGMLMKGMPSGSINILELGSGAGFLDELIPNIISSEVFVIPGVQLIADACNLPFEDCVLDAILMTDVFHHIPDVTAFLEEASRTLKVGGKIIMIEPWFTSWSYFVYRRLHSEPFIIDAEEWTIPKVGPLSGANGALPWIVFKRDLNKFENYFPKFILRNIRPFMPFSYLLSGGVSMRSFLPGFIYQLLRRIEDSLNQNRWGMFAYIEVEKIH